MKSRYLAANRRCKTKPIKGVAIFFWFAVAFCLFVIGYDGVSNGHYSYIFAQVAALVLFYALYHFSRHSI